MQLATRTRVDAERNAARSATDRLLAGASILLYLNSYRDSLKADRRARDRARRQADNSEGHGRSVVAAKDLYTATTIRESQLLEGAMSDPATLRDQVATRESSRAPS